MRCLVLCTLLAACGLPPVFAGELLCKGGDESVVKDYNRVIRLLQAGERLSADQEAEVLKTLDIAVASRCEQAALVLVDIVVNQAAAAAQARDTPQRVLDEYETSIRALLLEVERTGELVPPGMR